MATHYQPSTVHVVYTTSGSTPRSTSELPSPTTSTQQQQQQQKQQYYPRHPAFTSNRLGSIQSGGGSGSANRGSGFHVDRPMAGVLVIGGILLFVSMSLTAAVIVFCKKKNTVFVLQKSDGDAPGGGGDDSDLELDDILAEMDTEWQSSGDLRYTPLTLTDLPRLIVSVDSASGQRFVRCLPELEDVGDDFALSVLRNPHASDSTGGLSGLQAASLTRSQTCSAVVGRGLGTPSPSSPTDHGERVEGDTESMTLMMTNPEADEDNAEEEAANDAEENHQLANADEDQLTSRV